MCSMKLDRDSISGSLTLTDEPNYKAFKFSDNFQEMRDLKRDTKSNLDVHRQKGNADFKNLYQVNDLTAWREPEGKTPMDSDTPELVAFFDEEQDYQFVKDIFMDKEVPLMNKCLVEDYELDHKISSSMFNSGYRELDKETVETVSSMSNESKPGIKNDSIKDVKHEDDSDSDTIDEEVRKVPSREAEPANYMAPSAVEMADDNSYSSEVTSESEEENGSINTINSEEEFQHQPDFKITILQPQYDMSQNLTASGQSYAHQRDQVPCSGSNSLRSSSSSEEEIQHLADSEITFKPQYHMSHSLTCSGQSFVHQRDQVPCSGSNSLGSSDSSEEEFQRHADSEITFKPQDVMPESLTSSGQSFVHQRDQVPCSGSSSLRSSSSGEEEFNRHADSEITFKPQEIMPENLIASCQSFVRRHDQVPSSGSISLGSDSRNASSHSFAFPKLASEWNGSPVRMVTETKQMRKQKKWRICFLCFNF